MLSLLVSLGLLGLAAVDPVGIAVMPLLLTQTDGIRRSVWFLIGSALHHRARRGVRHRGRSSCCA